MCELYARGSGIRARLCWSVLSRGTNEREKNESRRAFFPSRDQVELLKSSLRFLCFIFIPARSVWAEISRAREREIKREARRGTNSPRTGADRVSESSWLAPQTSRVLNGSLAFPGTRAAPSGRQRWNARARSVSSRLSSPRFTEPAPPPLSLSLTFFLCRSRSARSDAYTLFSFLPFLCVRVFFTTASARDGTALEKNTQVHAMFYGIARAHGGKMKPSIAL